MRILLIPFFCCLLLACKKENKNYNSHFTLINAVPDSKDFTLLVGDYTVDSAIKYGMPAFNIISPAATTTLRWKQNGNADFDTTIYTDLPNRAAFSLIFFDSLKKHKVYLALDNTKQAASDKKGYVRFFPMVIGTDSLLIANDTNRVLIGRQAFGRFSSTFTAIDGFTTKLRLYNGNVLLDSIVGASVKPGKSYSIYAFGVLNQNGDRKPRFMLQEHE